MKHLFKPSLVYIIISACSVKHTENNYVSSNKPQIDSAYGFKIGDSFVHDSLITYGFILVKIEPHLLDFIPVKLDTSKNTIDKILNGQIRFVPKSILNPDNGEYGVERFSIMGDKDIEEFKFNFKRIGYLKLKNPYPHVSSSAYVGFTSTGLNNYLESYEYTWEGRAKIVKTTEILN